MILPLGLYEFVSTIRRYDRKAVRIFLFTFAPVLIWFLATRAVDLRAYETDSGWKSFMEYNEARMKLQDYRYDLLDYNKYDSRLEALGISENDAYMYLTWQFGDDTVLDIAKMRELTENAPSRWTLVSCFKALAQHIYIDVLIFDPLIPGMLFFLLCAYMALRGRKDRNRLFVLLSQLVILCGILVYYEYSGRWSHRIVFAALLVFTVSIVWFVLCGDTCNENEYGEHAYAALLITVFCAAVLLGNRLDYNRYIREMPDYDSFFAEIAENKDTLYIGDTFTFQYKYKYEVFKPYAEGSLDNFVTVGSWFVNSPVTKRITQLYGYSNPLRALAGADDEGAADKGPVILVDNMSADKKLTYINEHYAGSGETKSWQNIGDEYGLKMYVLKP